jgi:hypothetical protein
MIRAFPESGLVIVTVYGAVCTDAPEPFAVLTVNKIPDDVFKGI